MVGPVTGGALARVTHGDQRDEEQDGQPSEAGAERLGVDFTGSEPLAAAAEFFERFTQRGRDPGDDPEA